MTERAKSLDKSSDAGSLVPEWPRTSAAAHHWIHIEQSPRRVRVVFGGETIADSNRALLLREARCLPVYYFSEEDVRTDLMQASEHRTRCPYKGVAAYWTLRAGAKSAESAAWSYTDPLHACATIKNHYAFEWSAMDAWFEEEEEIFVHPRDPYKRVDAIRSARHVRVIVAGETVADTRRPTLVFETNHPVRYYIPLEDIRCELLTPSETVSRCPYKGIASYWSVRAGGKNYLDLAWSYREPIPECPKIKELVCFFQEREAVIVVDGEELPQLRTKWSR